ncbi:class I tRNA ligase family protein, partial [archaeon]|nr:class I tRNA ligase family protein [archaeon]
IPEAKDMEFFWKEFQERVNTELVGNFSNFIHRTLVFIEKNYNSIIPYFPQSELKKQDREFIKAIQKKAEETIALLNTAELRQGIESILSLTALANKYLQKNQPWKDKERGRVVLNLCANICGMLSFLIEPYLPSTAQKLRGMLNIKEEHLLPGIKNFKFKQEHKFNKPLQLFTPLTNEQVINLKEKTSKVTEYFKESQAGQEKIEKSKEQTGGEKMKSKDTAINATADITANEAETGLLQLCTGCHYIPFEVWKKMDLRIGKIIKIEPHPNAEKLYVMLVELGPGENKRQIVAGLKNFYKMEELLNKKIVLFTNLQPALIRGIESNGMLLAAEFKGKITLIVPEDKDFQEGAKVV